MPSSDDGSGSVVVRVTLVAWLLLPRPRALPLQCVRPVSVTPYSPKRFPLLRAPVKVSCFRNDSICVPLVVLHVGASAEALLGLTVTGGALAMLTPVQDARLKALLIPAELGSLAAVRVRARVEAFVGSMAVWRCRPKKHKNPEAMQSDSSSRHC